MSSDLHALLRDAVWRDLRGGFFRLDAEKRFRELSPGAEQLLGVTVGAAWPQVCFEPQAADAFLDAVRRQGGAQPQSRRLLLCREGGRRPFWAQVYAVAEHDAQGRFVGWLGYLRDVTAEEVRRRVDELPVGFYILRRDEKGRERIAYASDGFARLYGFTSPDDALGRDIRDLFPSEDNYQDFKQLLHQRTQGKKGSMLGWKNEVRARDEQPKFITADMTWRLDPKGIVERWGVLRDVSQDEFFAAHVHDYAVVLHTYSTALIGAQHALDALRVLMQPDPFSDRERAPSPEEAEDILNNYRKEFERALQAVLQQAQERNLHDDILRRFAEYLERMKVLARLQMAGKLPTYLELGGRVLHHIQALRSKRPQGPTPWFSRDVLRQARVAAWDLARISALVLIYQSESHLLEVDHEIRLFRDFWTRPLRPRQYTTVDLTRILEESMLNLDAFARKRGVRWRRYGTWPEEAPVRGDGRGLQRAFSHLLHNAIKYSWERARGTWVGVRLVAQKREDVPGWLVEIENYGVPIAKDELEAIFQFGYRGRLSQDRARVGTGIGLYDAKQVFEEAHNGLLELESHPASGPENALRDARGHLRPHLTTARVWLPRYPGG